MEKKIVNIISGKNNHVGKLLVNRLFPDERQVKIGPFVFLDHIYPVNFESSSNETDKVNEHPHRGIATFSYMMNGEIEYYDSLGNHQKVSNGNGLWMNAGRGIIHCERPSPDFLRDGGLFHALQFWINLPASNKNDQPDYKKIGAKEFPEAALPYLAGKIRVLIGRSGVLVSPVKTFLDEFIYHIRLNPKSSYTFQTKPDIEYGIFVPDNYIRVNGKITGKSELIILSIDDFSINLHNPDVRIADLFLFGGATYKEPIVAKGPFVMNTAAQISEAYNDFFAGKYGHINLKDEILMEPAAGKN